MKTVSLRRTGSDRGSSSVMFALLALGLFTAVAMVVDGGRRLNAVRDARHLADNAARIGAQAVDPLSWRTDSPAIDWRLANEAVRAYADHPSNSGRVASIVLVEPTAQDLNSQRVVVEVVLLPVDGLVFDAEAVTARSTAFAASGVAD